MNTLVLLLAAGASCSPMPGAGWPPHTHRAASACCALAEAPGQAAAPSAAPQPGAAPIAAGADVRVRLEIPSSWRFRKPDLTRAVVYLDSHEQLDAAPRQTDLATIAQKRKRFIPDFLAVSMGTVVEFPNWDDFDHNVFSRSEAAPAFDLDRYPRGQAKSRVFEKVGVVQVFCNIHPQMRATVVVAPNRYFDAADEAGEAVLEGVPPGTYELVAWHAHCEEHRQTIEVADDGAEVTITLREERASILRERPRDSGYGVEAGLGIGREALDLPVVEESHPARSEEPR